MLIWSHTSFKRRSRNVPWLMVKHVEKYRLHNKPFLKVKLYFSENTFVDWIFNVIKGESHSSFILVDRLHGNSHSSKNSLHHFRLGWVRLVLINIALAFSRQLIQSRYKNLLYELSILVTIFNGAPSVVDGATGPGC